MRLTRYTDYSLRVLMYVGARDGAGTTIGQIAAAYGISRDHLMKVVQELGRTGYLHNMRGRSGGLSLALPPEKIIVGDVVRQMESDFELADCGHCVIEPVCLLTGALQDALAAFLKVLDGYSLADLLSPRDGMLQIFGELS